MSREYSLSSIAVIHLDTGNDRNGNSRRGFALINATTGSLLAYEDEGYAGELACLQEVLKHFRLDDVLDARNVAYQLYCRRTERIRIAPSYRTHLLRREARERVESLIYGKPTLTA